MRLINWYIALINNIIFDINFKRLTNRKKKKTIVKLKKSIQFDERFCQIFKITSLKKFKYFNKV